MELTELRYLEKNNNKPIVFITKNLLNLNVNFKYIHNTQLQGLCQYMPFSVNYFCINIQKNPSRGEKLHKSRLAGFEQTRHSILYY